MLLIMALEKELENLKKSQNQHWKIQKMLNIIFPPTMSLLKKKNYVIVTITNIDHKMYVQSYLKKDYLTLMWKEKI